MNISLPCPICRDDESDLDIDVTIVHDTQGEPPYTGPLTTLDEYEILWEQSGHGKCEQLWDFANALANVPRRDMSTTETRLAGQAAMFIDKFEDAIFSAAIDAEADYGP